MKRYDFNVPEWCRTIWVSTAARELWAPRIQRVSNAWQAVELLSVGEFRPAARQTLTPERFVQVAHDAVRHGCIAVPLEPAKISNTYQAAPALTGAPGFNVLIASNLGTARSFLAAYKGNDDLTIGDLLGFPPCCSAFFKRVWVEEGLRDTTFSMSENSLKADIRTFYPIATNILLRWIGIRMVPHLPCSFSCTSTRILGDHFEALLKEKFPQEAKWLRELLDAPIEWSSRFGVAEIRHPLFKVSTKTDAYDVKLSVQRDAENYPELGAQGNEFPYRRHVAKMTVHPAALVRQTDWTDNGFSSLEAMEKAHGVIRDFIKHRPEERLLDLGCGNGRLAASIAHHAYGVESDAQRAQRAVASCTVRNETIQEFVRDYDVRMGSSHGAGASNGAMPESLPAPSPATSTTAVGEMYHYETVLLMPGRLLEMEPYDALLTRQWLKRHAKNVVLYAYGDQLKRFGSFAGLCHEAKLHLKLSIVHDDVAVGFMELEP